MQRRSVHLLSRRTGGAAVLAIAVASAACTLDRGFLPPGPTHFTAYAIVRNAAGVEVAVTETDDLFAAEMFVLAVATEVDGERIPLEEREARARARFSRAVARRLAAPGDAVVAARFGPGPWCFVMPPILRRPVPGGWSSATSEVPPDELGADLPPCVGPPAPAECSDGGEPTLDVDPPAGAFGEVPQGRESSWVPFVLRSGPEGVVCLASVVLTGRDLFDFQLDDSDCRPTEPGQARRLMGDGEGCTLLVRFGAERPGPKEAALRISSNVEGAVREISLSGRSVPGTLGPLTPICATPRGDGTFLGPVTLRNAGPGDVTLRSHGGLTEGWGRFCDDEDDTIAAGEEMTCTLMNYGPIQRGTWFLPGDAYSEDGSLRIFEIPLIPQVTPETCTP